MSSRVGRRVAILVGGFVALGAASLIVLGALFPGRHVIVHGTALGIVAGLFAGCFVAFAFTCFLEVVSDESR